MTMTERTTEETIEKAKQLLFDDQDVQFQVGIEVEVIKA